MLNACLKGADCCLLIINHAIRLAHCKALHDSKAARFRLRGAKCGVKFSNVEERSRAVTFDIVD